jgi:hypothetical protein
MISFHFRFGFGSVPLSLSYTWSLLSLPYTTTLRSISILRFHYGPTIYALLGVLPLCPVASPCALWTALVPCGQPFTPIHPPTALYTHTPTYHPSPTPYRPPPRISIFTSFSLFQFFSPFLCHFTP